MEIMNDLGSINNSTQNLIDSGMKVEKTLESGTIYSFSDAGVDGVSKDYRYMIYVPNDYDENTPVHAFMHGAGDTPLGHRDAIVPFVNSINSGYGKDSALIFYDAKRSEFNDAESLNKLLEVSTYEPLERLGISTNNITFEGFSAGGKTALRLTAQHLKNNPDLPPQVVVTYDATCLNYDTDNPNAKLSWNAELSDDEVQALVDNRTTLITFEQIADPDYDPVNSTAVKYLTRRGVDVVYVKRNTESGHFICFKRAIEDGATDYLNGESNSLRNSDNYTFMRWVPDETKTSGPQEKGGWKEYGEWVPLTTFEVATLISKDMMSYIINRYKSLGEIELAKAPVLQTGATFDSGMLQSDLDYVINNVNTVRVGIKNSSFLNAKVDSSFLSTAKMPVEIVNYMHDSLEATGFLLSKLNDATDSLIKIGRIFENLDTELEENANNLLYDDASFVDAPGYTPRYYDGSNRSNNSLYGNDKELYNMEDDYSDLTSEDDYDLDSI